MIFGDTRTVRVMGAGGKLKEVWCLDVRLARLLRAWSLTFPPVVRRHHLHLIAWQLGLSRF